MLRILNHVNSVSQFIHFSLFSPLALPRAYLPGKVRDKRQNADYDEINTN
jgi:hypothetical protein